MGAVARLEIEAKVTQSQQKRRKRTTTSEAKIATGARAMGGLGDGSQRGKDARVPSDPDAPKNDASERVIAGLLNGSTYPLPCGVRGIFPKFFSWDFLGG